MKRNSLAFWRIFFFENELYLARNARCTQVKTNRPLGPTGQRLVSYQVPNPFDLLRSVSVYQEPNSAPPCFRHARALHSHANPSSGSPWGPR